MDDDGLIGSWLMNTMSREQQLVAAITSNMSDTVRSLVRNGGAALVNAVLQQQNGRQALHLACQSGRHEYIDFLVAAGARPDAQDFFGMTPLDHALRSGAEQCVEILLGVSRGADPATLWTAQTRAGVCTWRTFSQPVVSLLIIATPNFAKTEAARAMRAEHFQNPTANEALVRTYLLTGNQLPPAERAKLTQNGSAEIVALMRSLSFDVPSLAHICRLVVRRNVRTNVIYAARNLPVPSTLQQFLISVDFR